MSDPLDRAISDLRDNPEPAERPPPDEAAGGRTFGKFRLTRELGRGGMGRVWRAWQTDLRRWVALKLLDTTEPDARKRFLREARSAAGLEHRHIVRVHESGEEEGRPWIAMEYVEGTTLLEAGLSLEEAMRVLAEVAGALDYAHRRGIVHRDVKPANILVDAERGGKIGDFGLARELEEGDARITRTGTIVGSAAYMAPEQARAELRAVDARSDVWALGATLYHVATGTAPFQGAGFMEVALQVAEGAVEPPRRRNAGVPRDLETVILKAMSPEKALRYTSAAEFRDDLERCLRGTAVRAKPAPWTTILARRVRRAPKAWAAVALLTAVAALAISLAAVQSRERRGADRGRRVADWALDVSGAYFDLVSTTEDEWIAAEDFWMSTGRTPKPDEAAFLAKVDRVGGRYPATGVWRAWKGRFLCLLGREPDGERELEAGAAAKNTDGCADPLAAVLRAQWRLDRALRGVRMPEVTSGAGRSIELGFVESASVRAGLDAAARELDAARAAEVWPSLRQGREILPLA
ncbi:MAG: hypothetical protein FD180_3230, partial [Planctomycetota bacterium]